MVIWFIGMSASGKTTISTKFISMLKMHTNKQIYHLDGDNIRFLFNNTDYSIQGRELNAKILSELSKFLQSDKVVIVASVLSIFPLWQKWNRENIHNYYEIYVKVDFNKLVEREIKGIYKEALNGLRKDVVGVDIPFPEPKADYILDNNGNIENDVDKQLNSILNIIKNKI
jgi:adenylylsulfate kinase-like enzyme